MTSLLAANISITCHLDVHKIDIDNAITNVNGCILKYMMMAAHQEGRLLVLV